MLGLPIARLVPWIVLFLGLGTTAVLYVSIDQALERRNRTDFAKEVGRLTNQMDAAVRQQVAVLNATAGVIAANRRIGRADFSAFYENLVRGEVAKVPSVIGVSFWRPWNRRAELTVEAAERGVTGFRLQPTEPRPEVHAIVLLEPLSDGNAGMPGFDMRTEPLRRAAMDAARDADRAVMTPRIVLRQDAQRPLPAFLLYLPVYEPPIASPKSVGERRARLTGFVYSGLRAPALFGALDDRLDSAHIGLKVWSGGTRREDVVYEHGADPSGLPPVTKTIRFNDAVGEVRAEFVALKGFGSAPVIRNYVIPVGAVLSVLLFFLASVMRHAHEASQRREADQTLLAETGRLVATGADNEAVLREIAERMALTLDAVCRIDLLEDGALRTVSTRVQAREAHEALEREYPRLEHDVLFKEAIATGRTQRTVGYPSIHDAYRSRVEAAGVGPILIVPLWVADHALGAVTLVRPKGRAAFSADAAALAEAIAGRMALGIENARLYHDLERRVTERTRDLEASNHELESFCYSVSHDLRTPLRSLDGFGKALEEDYGDRLDAQGLDFIGRIRAATRRMDELITALLTLSRLTRREIVPIDVDVSAMVRDQLHDLDPEGKVQADVQDGVQVRADPRMLAVAFDNLLANALKFSSRTEGPRIAVGQTVDGEIYVRDNGAGFDMAYAGKLFQPFERLHSVREFPGHGIGLATVERIVRRHGGEVRAEGASGEGATFFMRFPE